MAEATFYYDFNSPYAYLAAERMDELVPGARWTPIAFAILLNEQGRLEERLRNPRAAAVADDVSQRLADRGMPEFAPPESWPIGSWSLAPLRAALVADELGRQKEFAIAAFRTAFVEGRPLSDVENVLAAAREAGLDPAQVEEGIARAEIKDRLKQNTDEALERGVTGIPTVAIDDELFWGDDHLEDASTAATR